MKTYLLTSSAFEGEIVFQFNDQDILMKYDITSATLNAVQLQWITQRLPRNLIELKMVLKQSKGARLVEQKKTAVTFELFWFGPDGRARWPRNSSKKKAEKNWNRMAQRERDKAVNYLETYLQLTPDGVAMMYAETYLNRELWNN